MRIHRTAVGALAALAAGSGCATLRNNNVEQCASISARHDALFDSTTARTLLAGRFRLIMISESINQYSKSTSGSLELAPVGAANESASGPSASGPSASGASASGASAADNWPVLSGSAQLSAKSIAIPWAYDPSSRDPNRPGVLVRASGDVDLGGPRSTSGPWVSMHIQSVSRDAFTGTWTSAEAHMLPVESSGKPVPAPHGRFCATRRG